MKDSKNYSNPVGPDAVIQAVRKANRLNVDEPFADERVPIPIVMTDPDAAWHRRKVAAGRADAPARCPARADAPGGQGGAGAAQETNH